MFSVEKLQGLATLGACRDNSLGQLTVDREVETPLPIPELSPQGPWKMLATISLLASGRVPAVVSRSSMGKWGVGGAQGFHTWPPASPPVPCFL